MNGGRTLFPVVGIGASAGGIEALEGLFRGVPENTGCGFVVITHLSPDRRSLLPQILTRYTSMPVRLAEDGVEVQPDEVFVLPGDAILDIEGGRLHVRKPGALRQRKPIDVFFAALAKDVGEHAAGIVLSGGDGDGTLGVKAIKEHGGLTMAQVGDGDGPKHPSMPDSAIASGMIDIAAPAAEMGAHLVEFARSFGEFDRLVADEKRADGHRTRRNARQEICAILRNQMGHDFSGYKERTFLRRVHRRMQVNRLEALDAYVEQLTQDPKEVAALFRDLLIHVTSFFRDADAFKVLEDEVIPKLFAGKSAEDSIRVWVPGCATGEEVFSIAILMREHMRRLTAVPRVQIFATDIDESGLTIARAARYPEALLEGVSEERRRNSFSRDNGSFVVTKEVRDLCVFSPHSVLRDPPFSRLDLVSCRNLLIYFGRQAQDQVIPTFHYALRPGGYLFLGISENISQFTELFTAVDKKHRVFRRRDDIAGAGARLPLVVSGVRTAAFSPARHTGQGGLGGVALRQSVEAQMLEQFSPAHVVVNRDGDIVYYSARTGKYLEAPGGVPTRQLVTLARPGLRLDLRGALAEASKTDRRVERDRLFVESEADQVQQVDLMVEPIIESAGEDRLFLVVFKDVGPTLSQEEAADGVQRADEPAAHLERELRDTRERLQSMVEEYETALEELKSSNEELVSVNEELQSTNEELEASKEELQSLNEELHTVNGELVTKVDQLDRANADLTNIFECTKVATVFLDRNLVIRSFTPAAAQVFKVLPTDRGRPLTDLSSRVSLPSLADDVRSVFSSGELLERAIENESGAAHYLMKIVPYRDGDQKIDGVVLTFVDVTTIANAEAHRKVLVAELNHRVKNMLMVVIGIIEQTSRTSADAPSFKAALIERVMSMAHSYELLAREAWTDALLDELIRLQLAPFGLERVRLEGPELRLTPRQALSLGMVVHELATNAGKHGALAVPGGRVELHWELRPRPQGGQEATLVWSENGGPAVAAAPRDGFGLKLVRQETAHALAGEADIRFRPEGLIATVTFPLEPRS